MLQRTLTAGFIAPCLPSPAERPPSGPRWIHEIKQDGYRMMARREGVGVSVEIGLGDVKTGVSCEPSSRAFALCLLPSRLSLCATCRSTDCHASW
jgi:hypothetical protein